MEVNWLGRSCFRLRGRDVTVVMDPPAAELEKAGQLQADVATLSQGSVPAHGTLGKQGMQVVAGPGEYEIKGTMITGVATPRAPGEQRAGPRNTAYVVEIDDVSVCHLGDLTTGLTADQVAVVKDADVLLVPVGGRGTIDGAQAAEVVALVEPRLVIPMRFRTPDDPELDEVDRFCREIGAQDLRPQPRLTVTRSSLPEQLTVVLLEPRK
jgi:L-ascorbate metabolism protein UlaG (beta-lactamase superfamily)